MKFQLGALLMLAALAWGQKDIPIEPWDEGERTYHLPRWCQATDKDGYKKNCGKCDMACNQPSNYKCSTHCKKGACKCPVGCIPTGRVSPMDPREKAALIAKGDGAKVIMEWAMQVFWELSL